MKKKAKILLGVAITLIIAIVCYVIVGVIIMNSPKEHTVSAISLYSLELLTNKDFKRNEDKEKQLKNEIITETELIEFLEDLKTKNKIESYEQDEYGITVYFPNSGRLYCDYDLPEGYQAKSKNSDNSRNNEVNISKNQSSLSVLCAQPCDDISSDVFDNSAKTIANADLGYEFTSNVDNSDVTIEFMKSLSNYRVIIWNAHGGYDKNGSSRFLSGENWYNWDNTENYIEDENTGRIIRYMDGTVGVTSSFFEYYYEDDSFNDSLIYLGSCMGAVDSVLSDTLIKKGAEAVLAYNSAVYTTYNQKMCESICNELVKQDGDTNSTKTVAEALETAKKQNGEKDPTNTAWYDFILHPIFQDYVKKADRAELILTENDDNSFRLVDENKKEDNKQDDNIDYEEIYYQYIKDNFDIIDYDKFPADENNTGVFSALIEDFDNDNVKEMITFSYEKEKGGSVVLNLYKYVDSKVKLCDTSKETIYASGGGNFATNLCGVFEDKTIKIVYDNYSFGGSSNASEYMSYQVENDKLTLVNNYVVDIFPRYDRFEYKETVSNKTFSNSDDFNNAVISSGYDVKSHLHAGYSNSKFNPETDTSKDNELFKGNHIFTLINSNSMIKSGIYGFINDNTELKTKLGIFSSSDETTTKEKNTVQKETSTKERTTREQSKSSDNFKYRLLDNGTISITKYEGKETSLNIPTTIDGYTVTSIDNEVFSYNLDLVKVVIPDSIITIGESAFYDCENLENVTLSKNITSIEFGTFGMCYKLENISIGNKVEKIGQQAFQCCNLKNIIIPNSVNVIDDYAFSMCRELKEISFSNNINTIGTGAFGDCISLKNVHFQGTKEEWINININVDNECLTNSNIQFN